jgi:hypothetical protein
MIDLGKYYNRMGLGILGERRYETIFRMYMTGEYKTYNILQAIQLPEDLDSDIYEVETVPPNMPLTVLSYRVYGTMDLWWLICLANGIDDPTRFIAPGVEIRIIKPEYVSRVITGIQKQLR